MSSQVSKSSVKISAYKNWDEFSKTKLGKSVADEVQESIIKGSITSQDLSQESFKAELVQDDTPKPSIKSNTFKR